MAAPNIVNVTTLTGKTAVLAVTTSATAVVSNAASSGKVLKINSLTVANVDGANTVDISVEIYNTQRTPTSTRLAYLLTVPPKSTLFIIGKDGQIYLEEGDSIRLTASANSDAEAVCSYEEIS